MLYQFVISGISLVFVACFIPLLSPRPASFRELKSLILCPAPLSYCWPFSTLPAPPFLPTGHLLPQAHTAKVLSESDQQSQMVLFPLWFGHMNTFRSKENKCFRLTLYKWDRNAPELLHLSTLGKNKPVLCVSHVCPRKARDGFAAAQDFIWF